MSARNIPDEKRVYDETRHFEDGFNDVYCKCNAHVSEHANQHGPYEIRIDRTKWFCPIKKPESDMDILRSMMW